MVKEGRKCFTFGHTQHIVFIVILIILFYLTRQKIIGYFKINNCINFKICLKMFHIDKFLLKMDYCKIHNYIYCRICSRFFLIDNFISANKNEVMDQLKLALAWNRIDIAKSDIFTEERLWKVREWNRAHWLECLLMVQVSSGGFRWVQVGLGEYRLVQVGTGEYRWVQVGIGEYRWVQVGTGEYRWVQVVSGGNMWVQVGTCGNRWVQVGSDEKYIKLPLQLR